MDIKQQENIKIAKDTLKVIKQGYFKKNGERCILTDCMPLSGAEFNKAQVFSPEALEAIVCDDDDFFECAFRASDSCDFYLLDADSFEAASSYSHCVVMNFANAKHPGGGFLNGAKAQEESLCRCSTLYSSLSSEAASEMYEYNKNADLPCYSDYMILSKNVCVFRDIDGNYLDEPFHTAVMTVPAPNRKGAAKDVPEDVLYDVIATRLFRFLLTCAHEGYRELVLGAWGCGAFGNDPKKVAEIFCDLFFSDGMEEFFDSVSFAILGKGENYRAFADVFGDRIEICGGRNDNDSPVLPGFCEGRYRRPALNYSVNDIGKDNLGYTYGILSDGTPFEADLWTNGEERNISVYIPEKNNITTSPRIRQNEARTGVVGFNIKSMYPHNSVLCFGMVERDIVAENDEMKGYVQFLVDMGIIRFHTELLNGGIQFFTDVEGNDIVCINIFLSENKDDKTTTDLHFMPFPNQPLRLL